MRAKFSKYQTEVQLEKRNVWAEQKMKVFKTMLMTNTLRNPLVHLRYYTVLLVVVLFLFRMVNSDNGQIGVEKTMN